MMSAGQLLQSERLKRNRSLAEIATDTCISARYLEAIERDDIKQLPGDFFYKSFLRQYARALDLDAATTDRVVASAVPVEEVDPLPVLSEVYQKANEPTSSRWSPSTAVAVGSLILVLAGGAGLYSWFQRVQTQKETAAEQAASAPTPVPTVQTPQQQPPAQTPAATTTPEQTAGTTPSGSQQQPQQTPAANDLAGQQQQAAATTTPAVPVAPAAGPVGSGNIALEIVASEPTWVQITSGGRTLYIGILNPAQARQFAVAENARLLTGNAGALDVRMNGRSVGSLGPKGQVRTVYFSNDSFQIAPPKAKPATIGEGTTAAAGTASVALRPTSVAH
ncbi:MAG: DUF4115 domain-containing protein [Bryobacteraceae bacterium]|nr:DUF4115 domain-containing protein [Bryobacteraceae bacterium]